MSDTLELISSLQPSTVGSLYAQAKMFAEKPTPVMKWHCCVSSPLIGQKTFSFDDFDSLRRELTKSVSKLTLGRIHVYYGYELPVTTDSSGQNLFVTNMDGEEVPITDGWSVRKPINDEGEFGVEVEKVNLDNLL